MTPAPYAWCYSIADGKDHAIPLTTLAVFPKPAIYVAFCDYPAPKANWQDNARGYTCRACDAIVAGRKP